MRDAGAGRLGLASRDGELALHGRVWQFHFHLGAGAGAGVGLARPRQVRAGIRAHTMPRGAMLAPDGTEDAT